VTLGTRVHEVQVKVVVEPIAILILGPRVQLTVAHPVVLPWSSVVHSVFEGHTVGGDGANTLAGGHRFASYAADVVCSDTAGRDVLVANVVAVSHVIEVQVVPLSIASLHVCPRVQLTVSRSVMFSCAPMVHSVLEGNTIGCFCAQTLTLLQGKIANSSNIVRTSTCGRRFLPADVVFTTYLNIKIKVVLHSVASFTIGTTVELTISSFVGFLCASMVHPILESFTFRVLGTQLFTFVDCFASVTHNVVGVYASRCHMTPANSSIISRHCNCNQ